VSLYESLLRPLAFRVDPETVHESALKVLEKGLVKAPAFADPRLSQTLFGVTFQNPLGLAAGFDKNAVALDHWHQLGFGFVEVGTVTWHSQPGNPKPRMFRLPQDKALINRLGFNNRGAEALAETLRRAKPHLPFGINLGKSKITPVEEAARDYQDSFRLLREFGSYFVVNVSSPNTPGLRSLQEKGPLLEIFAALREVDPNQPMFVKVAPDLEWDALDDVVDVAEQMKLTGIIATNTTVSRDGISRDPGEAGGLSGAPLREKSNQVLEHLHKACSPQIVLIGVGGIMNGRDVFEKIALGAHLCQLYTGWIYGGPTMVPSAMRELTALMEREGIKTLAEMRGCKVRK
jgi:dihydroorotate dehydrogenase